MFQDDLEFLGNLYPERSDHTVTDFVEPDSPEFRLWLAVLVNAVRDVIRGSADARRWLTDPVDRGVGSLAWILTTLELRDISVVLEHADIRYNEAMAKRQSKRGKANRNSLQMAFMWAA